MEPCRYLFHPHFAGETGDAFLSFEKPEAEFILRDDDSPEDFFQSLNSATKSGFWLAGAVSYEAASILDALPKLDSSGVLARFHAFGSFKKTALEPRRIESPGELSFDMDEAEFKRKVEAVREALHRGDAYQVNLTMRANFPWKADPLSIFAALTASHPVPWSAAVLGNDESVLSLSPELFFKKRGPEVLFRPMKGTSPRFADPVLDARSAEFLLSDAKTRAENLMIVDLIRNDASRLCKNVRVPELFRVESYPTVHQLTSDVSAQLPPNALWTDLFRTVFPCGSVTGAPKYRAMELIRSLERSPRGVYTGAIGLISPDGDAVFNVAIRTLEWRDGMAKMGVGSGIVYDSSPEAEYRECLQKARFVSSFGR